MTKEIVSEKDVQNVATLSRLEFGTEEVKSIQRDLNEIVGYFSILQEVDTSKVEDVKSAGASPREDVVKASMNSVDVVKNAPDHNKNSYIVPRVVE